MTQTSLLPSMDPAVGGVNPNDHVDDVVEGDANRRKLMAAAGAAGVVIVGAAAFFLLHGHSGSKSDGFAPIHHVTPAVHGGAAKSSHSGGKGKSHAGPVSGGHTPRVDHHSIVRNPFKPLVTQPVAASAATGPTPGTTTVKPATTTGSSTTTTPGTSNPGTTNPGTTTPPVVTPTQPTHHQGGAPAAGRPLWIELVRTSAHSATFKVGYAHHKFRSFHVKTPKPTSTSGTTFDKIFALIGVEDGQATLQVGDATPFDLAKGEAHTL